MSHAVREANSQGNENSCKVHKSKNLFRLHQSAYCHIQVTISLFTKEQMEVETHILDKRKQERKKEKKSK